jgi:hypothetical protein
MLNSSFDTSLSVRLEVEGHACEETPWEADYREGIAAFTESPGRGSSEGRRVACDEATQISSPQHVGWVSARPRPAHQQTTTPGA